MHVIGGVMGRLIEDKPRYPVRKPERVYEPGSEVRKRDQNLVREMKQFSPLVVPRGRLLLGTVLSSESVYKQMHTTQLKN